MTEEQQMTLMIRGAIASTDQQTQEQVKAAYNRILQIEIEFQDAATMAIALRGAELAEAA